LVAHVHASEDAERIHFCAVARSHGICRPAALPRRGPSPER
jgi:hypothetical protein